MVREESPKPRLGTRFIVGMIVGATVLVTVSFAAGYFLAAPTPVQPATTSPEAGFARDMQAHHLQAVEMSMTVLDVAEDPAIRFLAEDIATAQQQQAGQMYAWLSLWGLPQAAPEPSMTWMNRPALGGQTHEQSETNSGPVHISGTMPGMATPEEMSTLKTLRGTAAETFFLELMIAHHQGGIEMAQSVLDRTSLPAVTNLARGMVLTQTSEIRYMNELLAQRT